MAVARPRGTDEPFCRIAVLSVADSSSDSPHSMVGSPTRNGPVTQQTSVPLTNLGGDNISGLVNALKGISINNPRDS